MASSILHSFVRVGLLALCLAAALAGCRTTPRSAGELALKRGQSLTLLYQAGREGTLEPCGCQSSPYGGLDREKNAVEQIRQKAPEALYLDAGNLFLGANPKPSVDFYRPRAGVIVKMLSELKLTAFAPGPYDYQLGLKGLRDLAKQASFPFISTNVVDKDGKPVFESVIETTYQGVRVAIVSAMAPKASLPKGLRVVPAQQAIKGALATLKSPPQVVVLLSQLGRVSDAREFLKQNPGVHLVVNDDPKVSLNMGETVGQTLIVDGYSYGFYLGKLQVDLSLPVQGFFSDALLEARQKLITGYTSALAKVKDPKRREWIEKNIANAKTSGPTEPVAGHSRFKNELIGLDAERFGNENSFTALIEAEKKRVKQSALDAGAGVNSKKK